MEKLKALPDLSRLFNQMQLREELEKVSDKTVIGFSIRNGLREKYQLSQLMGEILEAYHDNPDLMKQVVGEKALQLIFKLLKLK